MSITFKYNKGKHFPFISISLNEAYIKRLSSRMRELSCRNVKYRLKLNGKGRVKGRVEICKANTPRLLLGKQKENAGQLSGAARW